MTVKENQKLRRFHFFYRLYMMLSILSFFISIILFVVFYFTKMKSSITIADLFILLLGINVTFYFRLNALHYHSLINETEYLIQTMRPNRKVKERRSTIPN